MMLRTIGNPKFFLLFVSMMLVACGKSSPPRKQVPLAPALQSLPLDDQPIRSAPPIAVASPRVSASPSATPEPISEPEVETRQAPVPLVRPSFLVAPDTSVFLPAPHVAASPLHPLPVPAPTLAPSTPIDAAPAAPPVAEATPIRFVEKTKLTPDADAKQLESPIVLDQSQYEFEFVDKENEKKKETVVRFYLSSNGVSLRSEEKLNLGEESTLLSPSEALRNLIKKNKGNIRDQKIEDQGSEAWLTLKQDYRDETSAFETEGGKIARLSLRFNQKTKGSIRHVSFQAHSYPSPNEASADAEQRILAFYGKMEAKIPLLKQDLSEILANYSEHISQINDSVSYPYPNLKVKPAKPKIPKQSKECWKVQLIETTNRDEFMRQRRRLLLARPNIEMKETYHFPVFRVRIGKCLSEKDAIVLKDQFRKRNESYGSSVMVVPDRSR